LCLTFKGLDRYASRKALGELKNLPDKVLTLDVKEEKSKRSLQQNRLFWELCDRLTEATTGKRRQEDVDDMYISLLSSANAKAIYFEALPEAEENLKRYFRVVKKVDERESKGVKTAVFKCYEGSSSFDTQQMNELIDLALDKLHELGIFDYDDGGGYV
jgi:hypothetical protein